MNKKYILGISAISLVLALGYLTITVFIPATNGFSDFSTYKKARDLGFSKGQEYNRFLKISNIAREIGIARSSAIETFEKLNALSKPIFEQRVSILKKKGGLSNAEIRHGATLDASDDFRNYIDTIDAAHIVNFQNAASPDVNLIDLNKIANPSFPNRISTLREITNFSNRQVLDIATENEAEYEAFLAISAEIKNDSAAQEIAKKHLDGILAAGHSPIQLERVFKILLDDLDLTRREGIQALASFFSETESTSSDRSLRRVIYILSDSPFTSEEAFTAFFRGADLENASLYDDVIAYDAEKRIAYVTEAFGISKSFAEELDKYYPPGLVSRQRDYKKFVDWQGASELPRNVLLQIMKEVRRGNLSEYRDGANQYSFCSQFWNACKDNSDLANNFDGWYDAEAACKIATNNQARYGTPDWGGWFSTPFGKFYSGDNYVSSGVAILIEDNVKLQNGFGATVRSRVECRYDLAEEEVVGISVN
jgi:hypothetical protein